MMVEDSPAHRPSGLLGLRTHVGASWYVFHGGSFEDLSLFSPVPRPIPRFLPPSGRTVIVKEGWLSVDVSFVPALGLGPWSRPRSRLSDRVPRTCHRRRTSGSEHTATRL